MEYFYVILDKENVCVGIMNTIQEMDSSDKVVLESFDNEKLYHSYIDGVWSENVIESYLEPIATEEVTLDSLSTKIEQLTKILEENNITI